MEPNHVMELHAVTRMSAAAVGGFKVSEYVQAA